MNQNQTQPIPTPPKNQATLYWIILVVVAIIAIAGTTYAVWQSQKEMTKIQEIIIQPSQLPEVKVSTANWNTFRNLKYGYEIKYPQDWILEKLGDPYTESFLGGKVTGIYEKPVIRPAKSNLPEKLFILISVRSLGPSEDYKFTPPTAKGMPEENPIIKKYGKNNFYFGHGEFEAQRNITYEILNSDKSEAVRLDMIISMGRQRMDYYLPDKEIASELDVFHKMLSTFKFIKIDETVDQQTQKVKEPQTEKPQRIFNSKEECNAAGVECVIQTSAFGHSTGRYIRAGFVAEGESFEVGMLEDPTQRDRACALGLTPTNLKIIDSEGSCLTSECSCYTCLKCGDGFCGIGENWCICPEDCWKS